MYYDDDYLKESYRQKSEKLGRAPTAAELQADPLSPSYNTYRRRLGKKKMLCSLLDISPQSESEFARLCLDCRYAPENCGQDPGICSEEAELYYAFL